MFVTQSLRGMLNRALKVSTRSLSITTSFAARPHARPAPRKPSFTLGKTAVVEAALPPVSLLKSAKKSGALDIEPEAALGFLRKYVELSDQHPTGKWVRDFCAEEKITPRTVFLLSLILLKCREDAHKALATRLVHSASSMGEPSATLTLIEGGLRKGILDRSDYAAPLSHLRALATPPHCRVEAMVLLGEIYESQKQEEKALQLYRQASLRPPPLEGKYASGKGTAYALVRTGQILLRRSDRSGAEDVFRKAALEQDDPLGYYHLAKLQKSNSATRETYLLKAASSGIIEAAADLGQLQLARTKSQPAASQAEKATHAKLAKEWLYLAATADDAWGMLGLAKVFKDEGNLQSGLEWLKRAEKSKDILVASEAAKLRTAFGKVTASE